MLSTRFPSLILVEVILVRIRLQTISLAITLAIAGCVSASCATSHYELATTSLDEESYEGAVAHLEQCSTEGDANRHVTDRETLAGYDSSSGFVRAGLGGEFGAMEPYIELYGGGVWIDRFRATYLR